MTGAIPTTGNKSSGLARLGTLIASGNYVGISIGYRLSGEALWPAQIHDCKAAIRWLRANADRYGIDPERIGVWGSSAGGHLVNMLGTSGGVKDLEGDCGTPGQSSQVRCVVSYCGPTDFLANKRIQGGREPSAVSCLLGGALDEKKTEARHASPITYVSPDDPPFLLVHGTRDTTVPFEQAELFRDALRKAGVHVILVPIEGGGHGFGGPEVYQRVTAFLDKHLRGKDVKVSSDPIPATEKPAKGSKGTIHTTSCFTWFCGINRSALAQAAASVGRPRLRGTGRRPRGCICCRNGSVPTTQSSRRAISSLASSRSKNSRHNC
jgi:acetyl esterase/lipase